MKLLRPTDAALWLSCWRFVQWQGSCGMTCDIIACDMNRFLLDRESSNSIASKLIRIHLQKCTYLQRTSHCNKQSIYAVHLFPPLMDSEQKFASANSICAVHIVHQLCETKTFLKPGQGLCWRRFDTDEWRGGCWKLLLFDVCRPDIFDIQSWYLGGTSWSYFLCYLCHWSQTEKSVGLGNQLVSS